MATFSHDFSDITADTTAVDSSTTAITGWTWRTVGGGGGNSSYWGAKVVTDGTNDLGGKACQVGEVVSTGWGDISTQLYATSVGNVSAGTETEVLFKFKLPSIPSGSFDATRIGSVRHSSTTLGTHYSLLFTSATAIQLTYVQGGSAWAGIGSSITKTPSANTWYWARIKVTAAGAWSWRMWADGASEPGTWDVDAESDTTQTSGYVGLTAYSTATDPVTYGYFAIGTGGDAPPEPSGGSIVPHAMAHYRMRAA
jgi:hypothetical protein